MKTSNKILITFLGIIALLLLSLTLYGYLGGEKKITTITSFKWKNKTDSTTIPFYTHPSGHIYIKTELQGEEKYLLFDTGADFSMINEKYADADSTININMTDSQKKKEKINFFSIDSLITLGDLELLKMQFGAMKKETWENCGFLKNQDSIAGVLGNNVINNFVWNIDMVKHTMQISTKPFNKNSPNTKITSLIKNGRNWKIYFKLNGKTKKAKLDSGANSILVLEEKLNLPKTYKYPIINSSNNKGAFSYNDCDSIKNRKTTKKLNRRVFANLRIADRFYKEASITDNAKSNLLGIPLFWEHERVILDFLSKKMYLINPVKHKNKFSISKKSANKRMSARIKMIKNKGYFENLYKKSFKIEVTHKETKDTLAYKFSGTVKYYTRADYKTKSFNVDSIVGSGILLDYKNINEEKEKPLHLIMSDYNFINPNKYLSY